MAALNRLDPSITFDHYAQAGLMRYTIENDLGVDCVAERDLELTMKPVSTLNIGRGNPFVRALP
jgi:hypothetical protein